MAGENKTVAETEALAASGKGTLYTITKAQAERVLQKLGHKDKFVTAHPDPLQPTSEQTFIAGDHASALQEQGGLEGKIARAATKYLRTEGSSTTILLSATERKQVSTHGASLKKA
jgi:hypothetical protein